MNCSCKSQIYVQALISNLPTSYYNTIQLYFIQYNATLFDRIQYSSVLYNTIQLYLMQCHATPFGIALLLGILIRVVHFLSFCLIWNPCSRGDGERSGNQRAGSQVNVTVQRRMGLRQDTANITRWFGDIHFFLLILSFGDRRGCWSACTWPVSFYLMPV